MNVLLTDCCNSRCGCCFGAGVVRHVDTGKGRFMSMADFTFVLDFARRSEIETLSLLGGEPTLHPQFADILGLTADAGFNLKLFTNGIMSEENSRSVAGYPNGPRAVLVNVTSFTDYDPKQKAAVTRTLDICAPHAALGYTLHDERTDFTFLESLLDNHNVCRTLRLGIALPSATRSNRFVDPSQYEQLSTNIVALAQTCEKHDVLVELDCGFLLCMFSDQQLGQLTRAGVTLRFECSPIVDVGPDLQCWPCYPLYHLFRADLRDFSVRADAVSFFEDKMRSYRSFGVKQECAECRLLRRRQCAGGCLAHVISEFCGRATTST